MRAQPVISSSRHGKGTSVPRSLLTSQSRASASNATTGSEVCPTSSPSGQSGQSSLVRSSSPRISHSIQAHWSRSTSSGTRCMDRGAWGASGYSPPPPNHQLRRLQRPVRPLSSMSARESSGSDHSWRQ
jgi:hypothetical protein